MTYSNVFFGVSNHKCNNRKLFEFVQDKQKTGETVLQVRTRTEDGINSEILIGLPINVYDDGSIDCLSFCRPLCLWNTKLCATSE